MDNRRIIEFFKNDRGLDINLYNNGMGGVNVFINAGNLSGPTTYEGVDKLIKETILKYPPLNYSLKMDEKAHKKMADYETFFRLLRGGE